MINYIDFGPSGGLGLSYRKNVYQFTIGVQYNFGLATLMDGDYYNYPDYYSFATRNRNITCYFTVGFDIKGSKEVKYKKQLIN